MSGWEAHNRRQCDRLACHYCKTEKNESRHRVEVVPANQQQSGAPRIQVSLAALIAMMAGMMGGAVIVRGKK